MVALLPIALRSDGLAQPYAEDTLKDLAAQGIRKLTVVSPSFAVDCLETLEEIAIEYRDKFIEGRRALELGARAQRQRPPRRLLCEIARRNLLEWI